MGLKDVAIAAAAEQQRHEEEQRRITSDQMTETLRIRATQWVAEVFTTPDELLVMPPLHWGKPEAHVRWDTDWFEVFQSQSTGALRLLPHEQCPCKEGCWHSIDGSMHGLLGDKGITTLEGMGRWLMAIERSAPSVGRCIYCDQAMGAEFDAHGSAWVGFVTKLGDLPRMAAEHGIIPQP